MLSPLRYPGSKADLVPVVAQILNECGLSGRPFIEPYAGSASVSLALVEAGVVPSAVIGEQDPLLYSFWRAVFEHTDELLERFIDLPITLETWHSLRPLMKVKDPNTVADQVELGLAGLFFNRANFSGILNGGPIGGMLQKSQYKIDCRTNKDEIICRILAISTLHNKINVHFGDAVELIHRNKLKFAADNLEIVEGLAPEALKDLPAPTHAFIGGSSGNLKEIVKLLLEKNSHVRIVINCITLETVSEALETAKEFGFEENEIVQLGAARSKAIGRYHMMMGENPIYIITLQNPGK